MCRLYSQDEKGAVARGSVTHPRGLAFKAQHPGGLIALLQALAAFPPPTSPLRHPRGAFSVLPHN